MPVTDDLRAIAERADRELNAVHDFFEHSKLVWRSFKILVDQGHRVSTESQETGTLIDQDGLIRLTPVYTREYLANFTFRQFVSVFEVFLFDLLHRVFVNNPWPFSEKQLNFGSVIRAATRDEVISGVVLKQLNELKYESMREWFVAMNRALRRDCPGEDEVDALTEIKATRDILEHNAGVVNETYRRKAGKMARHEVGQQVELDDTYHLQSWRLIKKVVSDISSAAIGRLSR
ncbi:MAG: hypothetical protein ACYC61_05650 [Isosphaeraceae bacterium]